MPISWRGFLYCLFALAALISAGFELLRDFAAELETEIVFVQGTVPELLEAAKYKQINSEGCRMWAKEEEAMKPIRIPQLAPEQLTELEELYRTTRDARLRTRAQMVLLAAERRLAAEQRSPGSCVTVRRR